MSELTMLDNGRRVAIWLDEPVFLGWEKEQYFSHYKSYLVDLMKELKFKCHDYGTTHRWGSSRIKEVQKLEFTHPKIGKYHLAICWADDGGHQSVEFSKETSRFIPARLKTNHKFDLSSKYSRRVDLGNGIIKVIRSDYQRN